VAYTGEVRWVSDRDPQGNDTLYALDFSALREPGHYYAEIDGLGRSYDFQIGNVAPETILRNAARGFYFQRCGAELVQPYAGKWIRGMSHNQVWVPEKNVVHPWDLDIDPSDPSAGDWYVPDGPREIYGGHHDAGDFDTRLNHMVVPEKFMSLYEMFPERFHDGQFFIPEESNGVPDILDEAAWGLLHWEYLQDYYGEVRGEFGAVPAGMEASGHPTEYPTSGEGDVVPYYMRKATPYTTFSGAAIFAQAARVFEPYAPKRADKFLERAKAAYAYAVKHREMRYVPENPNVLPLAGKERYDQGNLAAAWCWAASQLFETTGDSHFMDDFIEQLDGATHTTQNHKWTPMWAIVSSKRSDVNEAVQEALKQELIEVADADVAWMKANGKTGYMTTCPNRGDWGNASPLIQTEVLMRAYMLTRDEKYLTPIGTAVDFVLGMNPSEMSWMTGCGTVYPMDPLNTNCKYDGIEEPFPGILIFGPSEVWNEEQNPLYPDPEHMGFYRRISDVWGYIRGCEYVIDRQMSNIYMAAALLLEDPE
jgi:endoglucanase